MPRKIFKYLKQCQFCLMLFSEEISDEFIANHYKCGSLRCSLCDHKRFGCQTEYVQHLERHVTDQALSIKQTHSLESEIIPVQLIKINLNSGSINNQEDEFESHEISFNSIDTEETDEENLNTFLSEFSSDAEVGHDGSSLVDDSYEPTVSNAVINRKCTLLPDGYDDSTEMLLPKSARYQSPVQQAKPAFRSIRYHQKTIKILKNNKGPVNTKITNIRQYKNGKKGIVYTPQSEISTMDCEQNVNKFLKQPVFQKSDLRIQKVMGNYGNKNDFSESRPIPQSPALVINNIVSGYDPENTNSARQINSNNSNTVPSGVLQVQYRNDPKKKIIAKASTRPPIMVIKSVHSYINRTEFAVGQESLEVTEDGEDFESMITPHII